MPLNLEESKYALSHILAVLMSPWQPGVNYDNLKAAADRHQKRIDELEVRPTPRAPDARKSALKKVSSNKKGSAKPARG